MGADMRLPDGEAGWKNSVSRKLRAYLSWLAVAAAAWTT